MYSGAGFVFCLAVHVGANVFVLRRPPRTTKTPQKRGLRCRSG
jgi:hypothetical protein